MSMSEAGSRYHLIAPLLRDKHWVSRDHITLDAVLPPPPVEPTGAEGRWRKGAGRSDYLPRMNVDDAPKHMPVTVLEAKNAPRTLSHFGFAPDGPVLDDAALPTAKAEAVGLSGQLGRLKQDKATRGVRARAAAIDVAVFDLKAATPSTVATVDERMPPEVIANIDVQGQIVTQAPARLGAAEGRRTRAAARMTPVAE